jgi:molybdate transport system substrate-binding protein
VPTTINLLSTTAVKSSLDELIPRFEEASTYNVVPTYAPSVQIAMRVRQNDTGDIVIATAEVVAELINLGGIVEGSDRPIARSPMGLAVPKGAPKPDISSAEKFKQTMLRAKSVATSNPVNGGQSGRYVAAIFERLGIAQALKPKTLYGTGGPAGLIGFFLTQGKAEIGIQQMSELLAVPGIDIVGPLPPEIQTETVFSAGLMRAASNGDGGRALIQFLTAVTAIAVITSKGLLPP